MSLPKELLIGFTVAGGLGLFLFGLHILPEALKRTAGKSLRNILRWSTKWPVLGLLTGMFVTALIQSSSATTVITVGFVNAGLMQLSQSVGVILGANIGTTVTGQLLAFKVSEFALPVIFIGVIIRIFAKRTFLQNIAEILIGFGLLFFGMDLMSQGVKPLKESGITDELFKSFAANPVLGVLVGAVATALLQSSSATVAIVIALVSNEALSIDAAIPVILGDNIGTCVTAMLASIGTNLAARRTAIAHLLFNTIGTIIVLIILPLYSQLVFFLSTFTENTPARQAANAHTIFNVANALLFLPFTRLYTRFIELIIPGKMVIKEDRAIHLDKNLLASPPLALDAVDKEVLRALHFSSESIDIVRSFIKNEPNINLLILKENENIIDNLQLDITEFLATLSTKKLSEIDAQKIPKLLHTINDIERIGDHGESLFYVLERKKSMKIEFPVESTGKLIEMIDAVQELLHQIIEYIPGSSKFTVGDAYTLENKINAMRNENQSFYFEEITNTPALVTGGMVYYDVLVNFEKIGDHLINVITAYEGIQELDFNHKHQ
ncbi:MAG: Na/Pi cotransporter family protein [Spirochaetales bacterium]|nr:Na/Pi cotransporter family protein [Spirochaetales bacterium]